MGLAILILLALIFLFVLTVLALVGLGADPAEFAEDPSRFDLPDSVIGFLNGELGDPPAGLYPPQYERGVWR